MASEIRIKNLSDAKQKQLITSAIKKNALWFLITCIGNVQVFMPYCLWWTKPIIGQKTSFPVMKKRKKNWFNEKASVQISFIYNRIVHIWVCRHDVAMMTELQVTFILKNAQFVSNWNGLGIFKVGLIIVLQSVFYDLHQFYLHWILLNLLITSCIHTYLIYSIQYYTFVIEELHHV